MVTFPERNSVCTDFRKVSGELDGRAVIDSLKPPIWQKGPNLRDRIRLGLTDPISKNGISESDRRE